MLEKLAKPAGVIDHPAQKREADSLHGTTSPAFTPRGPSSSEPSTDPTRPNTFHDGDDTNLDDDDDDDDAVRPTVTIGAPSEEMIRVLSGLDDRLGDALRAGDIKLLRVSWLRRLRGLLRQPDWRSLKRRQELEALRADTL